MTFGINGFGRIGRTAFRVWWQYHRYSANLAMINTSGSMEVDGWAYLLKYDSNYGVFSEEIRTETIRKAKEATDENPEIGFIFIGDRKIVVTAQRAPEKLPWGANGVHTVIESTGVFTDNEGASKHLQGGAQRVIISAPPKGDGIGTYVIGVNADGLSGGDSDAIKILSNASCTTNCVAPVTSVMVSSFGVEKAIMSTIHAYTDDQNLHDNSHRDARRSRAAAKNIVPTTTGAAVAVTETIPELKGLFDGISYRVPVSVGSLSDMVFVTRRPVTIEEVNNALSEAAGQDRWRGVLAVSTDPIVSQDIVGRRESSIVDLPLTNVVGGNLVKVVSWYDNEYGYCNRLVEQAIE